MLRSPTGKTKVINFILTQSRVSDQKRRRILNVVHTEPDFYSYEPEAWDRLDRREELGMAAASVHEFHEDDQNLGQRVSTHNFEACWSILQILSMEPAYLGATKYNLFSLFRLGNGLSVQQPVSNQLSQLNMPQSMCNDRS